VTTGLSADDGSGIEIPLEGRGEPETGPRRPRWAAALTTRLAQRPSLADVWAGLKSEAAAQLDRAVLWTPVAFGTGAAAYLGLKSEPPLWPLILLAAASAALAIAVRVLTHNRALSVIAALIAVAALGVAAGKIRSDLAAQPVVPAHLGVAMVEGWVMDVANPSARGERLVIAPVRVSGLSARPDALSRPHRGAQWRRVGTRRIDPRHQPARPAAGAGRAWIV
jgi:hypothetical protein